MIRYLQGNLLAAPAEALVNTVNETGVMGKGIALMFKEAFPESSKVYAAAAKRGEVHVGSVLLTDGPGVNGPRWIIHFPTKRHWRNPSKLEWVQEGLKDLVRVIREHEIRSVALPPLGSGQGKLDWGVVRTEIERALNELPDVDVMVFEPSSEYANSPKDSGVEELTPARALILELVRRYSILGLDCSLLEIQKLAWFLQRAIFASGLEDPLRLKFVANNYGPYADQLRHLTVVPADQDRLVLEFLLAQCLDDLLDGFVGVLCTDIKPQLVCRRADCLVRPIGMPGRGGSKDEVWLHDLR
jgi:O-acetyl-ADP-ribose deacetylase (regulator of RNase III)